MTHLSTGPSGEAFVESFANMTRSMMAQSRAISRKVSLAQLVLDSSTGDNSNKLGNEDEECVKDGSSSFGGYAREKVLRDLRSLDKIVSTLELRAAKMREAIDLQRRSCEEMDKLQAAANDRERDLLALCNALPAHLPCAESPKPMQQETVPCAAEATTTAAGTVLDGADAPSSKKNQIQPPVTTGAPSEVSDSACQVQPSMPTMSSIPALELVTVTELETVPKSTRARLTITQVNSAVTEIHQVLEKRNAFLAKPRAKMSDKQRRRFLELQQQALPAHEGEPFLSEADVRALPSFRKGEVTAKALVATLRSLKRIRQGRSCFTIQSWRREAQELDVVRQCCTRGNDGGIAVDAVRVLGLDGHFNPLADAHLRTKEHQHTSTRKTVEEDMAWLENGTGSSCYF